MIESLTLGEKIIGGSAGLGLLGLLIRHGITILGRQGLISAGDQSQKGLIESLSAERAEWRDLYEKKDAELKTAIEVHKRDMELLRQQHSDNMILLGEVRLQNKMLRMLLIQRGMTREELDAALEITDELH